MNLKDTLEKHKLWLAGHKNGARADLRGTEPSGADLSGASLCWADLSGANLRGSDLCGANLRSANLRGADLSGADLSEADLCEANLRGADLDNTNIMMFQYNKHQAIFNGSHISIGCEYHDVQTWLDCFEVLGELELYSKDEIEMYGNFIKQCMEVCYGNNN